MMIMIIITIIAGQPAMAASKFRLDGHLCPVSITRFPLRRFSPGAGLLRNPLFHR